MTEEKKNKCVVVIQAYCDGHYVEDCKYYKARWNNACDWRDHNQCDCPDAQRETLGKAKIKIGES